MEGKQGRRTVKRVRLSVGDVAACQDIVIPEHWSSAAEAVASHQGNPPIVVVCGPKNSGKSTFARFLVNTLLTRHKMVGYLDTDVGQPEYTPPGCLSLHIIDRPNHDLATPRLRNPESRCFFYGDISSKSDPRAYIACVTDLYDDFYEKHHRGSSGICGEACSPLVVNTPGWVKGVGYHILVDTLTHMAPTHVIQLRTSEPDKNLPTGAFWLRGDQEAMVDLINVDAAKQDVLSRSVIVQKHARLLRELRTVAYFRQCLPSEQNIDKYKELAYALAAHPPYEISISKVKVVHLHCQVPDSELFYSLNATIVGLASSSAGKTYMGTSLPLCVGLGIVRGIDTEKGVYYVLTPVPASLLLKVDLFLQGHVEIPTNLLQVRGCLSPYMSTNFISVTKNFREGSHTA
ncbi:polynucleotide 5'-hydroxyl-kinase NOL9 isoform X3 [Nymphaea colorata]|uniref:polynucleotide 5'-hydroxyl-kinase NOL9 isoform X3 n=1 Tax=Nymphaea colorata TaxID=210225 RepID=UPI00129D4D3F|nr:polynucleotide 5'-hydroxyl-kinase NOL9 isoform X3 [Nymphaea colorata]